MPIWSKNNILHPIMRNIIKDIFKTHARTHQDSLTPDELFIILEKIYPQHAIDTQFYFNRFANTEKGLTFYGLCDLFNRYFVTINNDDST